MRGVWDFMILTDKANLASNRLAYRCTRLYSHPVADDGASTSKLVPDDCSNDSDTDVYDSDVEEEKQQVLLYILF